MSKIDPLEFILDQSSSVSTVRIEIETEVRVHEDLARAVRRLYGIVANKSRTATCADHYFNVEPGFFMRIRDHTIADNRYLRGNVKVPLVPSDYEGHSPHVVEFTWDLNVDEYDYIMGKAKPLTTVSGVRVGADYAYPIFNGLVELKLAFDEIYSLQETHPERYTKVSFTEVSEEAKIFDEIPFGEFRPIFRRIRDDNIGFEHMLTILASKGTTETYILARLERADEAVRSFMESLVPKDSLVHQIYPQLQLGIE
ncbi:hypothetical protein CMO88_02930 [Candidatus Woesearchaeota archaeon]|nr:hypothetical protein [Candidatus Woesearchaeota archaeon]|tara:strand:- start:10105 stop:10869 length:765 start_codon:yes stop_codon:yes gene_type:complete